MQTVLIVIHLIIVLALVGAVLLQRSEGGGLGMGSGSASFMTGRGKANMLTRATAVLAALFFLTSLTLTILAGHQDSPKSIFDNVPTGDSPAPKQEENKGFERLQELQGKELPPTSVPSTSNEPQIPDSQ